MPDVVFEVDTAFEFRAYRRGLNGDGAPTPVRVAGTATCRGTRDLFEEGDDRYSKGRLLDPGVVHLVVQNFEGKLIEELLGSETGSLEEVAESLLKSIPLCVRVEVRSDSVYERTVRAAYDAGTVGADRGGRR